MSDSETPAVEEWIADARQDLFDVDRAEWAARVHEVCVWLGIAAMAYIVGRVEGWRAALRVDAPLMPAEAAIPPMEPIHWGVLLATLTGAVIAVPVEWWLRKLDEDDTNTDENGDG